MLCTLQILTGRLLFYPSVVVGVAFAVGAFVGQAEAEFEGLSALLFLHFAWQVLIMGGRIKARSTTSEVVMVALGMVWLARVRSLALERWSCSHCWRCLLCRDAPGHDLR